jgi:hypothetical protein
VFAERVLAPRGTRPQHVQTHPRDDRRQPPSEVLDAVRAGTAEPEPGFLDGVVRLAHRAEHPVGHRSKRGSVGFEAFGQPIVLVHRSPLLDPFRHAETSRTPPM